MLAVSPVPAISISLAPPEEAVAEPFSPFSATGSSTPTESDSFRPSLLSPPPTMSPRFPRQLSPLRPADVPVTGKGLERERFEELLRASKDRNAALGGKRSPDLRKEIAIKAHKSKQMERRALFLSKVQAPPSPSATLLPKTPPESPAIFHYSLPSPGLQSPLAVFEEMVYENPANPRRQAWVEQVEFHVPQKESMRPPACSSRAKVPSLDQITAHLSSHRTAATPLRESDAPSAHSARLPAFLKLAERSSSRERGAAPLTLAAPPVSRHAPLMPVGRLQFPSRSTTPPTPEEPEMKVVAPIPQLPPSPCSPIPKLQIRTTVVPCTSSRSPIELSVSNLHAFNTIRADTAKVMLTRLRKRTLPPKTINAQRLEVGGNEEEKKLRRHSAPPELPLRERRGFTKPPLNLPGAF